MIRCFGRPVTVLIVGELVAILAACLLVVAHQNGPGDEEEFELIRLFDYDYYKKTFGKSYDSETEESARRCHFYARALAAFVSGVNFKYRMRDYFNALNSMSDWTAEERAKTSNRGRRRGTMTRSRSSLEALLSKPLAFQPARGEQPEVTLRKFLAAHANNPVYADLLSRLDRANLAPVGGRRRKRSADGELAREPPRDFSFARLINWANEAHEFRREVRVASNNPLYAGIETPTRGLRDQIEEVKYTDYELPEVAPGTLREQLESSLGQLEPDAAEVTKRGTGKAKLADELFFDHRDSGCVSPVRSQGKCGACYAFASTAFFEWLYCKKTRRLVAFSEQYLIDCGRGRIEGAHGCVGGIDNAAVEFVHNFGLELRANYPYVGYEETCPYDDDTDLSTTGYIRMEMDSTLAIPMAAWHLFIERTPLYVVLDCDDDFLNYGGGVHPGRPDCERRLADDTSDYHAMLLVGHGRQDGQEYWLIRNSYGEDWGERGYYKLSKDVQRQCVQYETAYAFGMAKGFNFDVRPRKNRKNKRN